MCPRCGTPLRSDPLDTEVESFCLLCGYQKYTPVREGWFDGDELLAGASKPRVVALPQASSIRKRDAIRFEFSDENGGVQMMLLRDQHAECTCTGPRDQRYQCHHERWAEQFLEVKRAG